MIRAHLVYQSRIYRADLQVNPDVLYIFGDNCARVGRGGQAGEMRGEPNAVGVATKVAPSESESSFFSDDDFEAAIRVIERDLAPIRKQIANGGIVIAPLDGIGTGLSELPRRAPRIYDYLCGLGLGAQT